MTLAKASALTLGLLAAVAVGVAIGPSITNRQASAVTTPEPAVVLPIETRAEPKAAPRARAKRAAESAADATVASVAVSAPELHERLKPVLNRGANMTMAADGFRNAEQFATVAYVARNTKVPFMVLKHRVVSEGQTIERAIAEYKPELNAMLEVQRARAEARAEIASLVG